MADRSRVESLITNELQIVNNFETKTTNVVISGFKHARERCSIVRAKRRRRSSPR